MEKDKFEELLGDEMNNIKIKLESEPYGDRLTNRLHNANQIGVMDRFRFFFNEIDLRIDENEWKAIEARNDVAHGRIASTQERREHMIQHTSTYETLIHKILLRLLGYSGSYIDRSVLGWEDKQLPAPHPENPTSSANTRQSTESVRSHPQSTSAPPQQSQKRTG